MPAFAGCAPLTFSTTFFQTAATPPPRQGSLSQQQRASGAFSRPSPRRGAGDMTSRVTSTPAAAASETVSTSFERIVPSADGGKIVVALGKFDAMHRGHALLASRAAQMGAPHLMSFSGMAEVLGWESKLPVVAACDRPRVCESWAPKCGEQIVKEHCIPFAAIRRMSPEEFVLTLRDAIGVGGVVAGRNYRFGFKAAGTSATLVALGEKHEIMTTETRGDPGPPPQACQICFNTNPLFPGGRLADEDDSEDGEGATCTPQVSSTRVRACLAAGDVEQAGRLLGRRHRLVLQGASEESAAAGEADSASASASAAAGESPRGAVFPLSAALNQYPAAGRYAGELSPMGSEGRVEGGSGGGGGAGVGSAKVVVPVTVVLDESEIRLEADAGVKEALDRVVDCAARVCVEFIARTP